MAGESNCVPPPIGFGDDGQGGKMNTDAGRTLSGHSLEYEHPGGDDMSAQLLKQALAPFRSLQETLDQPAWCATFARHLLDRGDGLDLFYLISLLEFDAEPTEQRARQLYQFFFVIHGLMTSLEVDKELIDSVERQLNQPEVNLAVLQKMFDQPREDATVVVNEHLAEFSSYVSDPAHSAATGAAKLISLVDDEESGALVTESGVVKAMLIPHMRELMEQSDEESEEKTYNQLLIASITDFFEKNGIEFNLSHHSHGSSIKARSKVKTNQLGARYRGRKIHTHKGHRFVVTTYMHPTWCGHCGNLLWGLLKQGWKCVDCGFDVHKAKDRTGYTQCHRELVHQCPGFREKKSWAPRRNSERLANDSRRVKSPTNPIRRAAARAAATAAAENLPDAQSGVFQVHERQGSPESSPVPRHRSAHSFGSDGSRSSSGSFRVSDAVGDSDDEDDEDDDEVAVEIRTVADTELENPLKRLPKVFKEWCDSAKYKLLDKKERSRQEALYELTRTELEYSWYLLVLENVFKVRATQSGVISQRDIVRMFGNISALVSSHHKIRTTLNEMLHEKHPHDAIPLAGKMLQSCFASLEKTDFAQWVSNQDVAREVYHSLDNDGAALMRECEKWKPIADKKWKLTDLIAQPLQRVARYPLLLRAILKYTPAAAIDECAAIKSTIDRVEELLVYLNRVRSEADVRRRLQTLSAQTTYSAEITGLETDWILKMHTTQTEIICSGSLELKGPEGKREQDLEVYLFSNALLILRRQKKDKGGGLQMERFCSANGGLLLPIVLLGGVHCTANGGEKAGTSFYVIRSEPVSFVHIGLPQMYEFVAPSKAETKKWIKAVSDANRRFQSKHPDWKEVLVERYSKPRQSSPLILRKSAGAIASGTGSESSTEAPSNSVIKLRRSSSERVTSSQEKLKSARPSLQRSPIRRESMIADHGAQAFLEKCCSDLILSIENFEHKGDSKHVSDLRDELEHARNAVNVLRLQLNQMDPHMSTDIPTDSVVYRPTKARSLDSSSKNVLETHAEETQSKRRLSSISQASNSSQVSIFVPPPSVLSETAHAAVQSGASVTSEVKDSESSNIHVTREAVQSGASVASEVKDSESSVIHVPGEAYLFDDDDDEVFV